MSAKDGESTFRINIDGNAAVASKDVAASARLAAKSIAEYENEVKVLSGDLRRLRGNSEEVNAAKAALRKRIDEAKTSVSTLTTALAKQNTTYAAAAAAAKKYGDGVGKLPNLRKGIAAAVATAGKGVGPLAAKTAKTLEPITKKIGALVGPIAKVVGEKLAPAGRAISKYGGGATKALTSLGKAAKQDLSSILPSLGTVLGVVASGAALAAAAIIAVGVAGIGAGVAIGAFGLAAAAAASKMHLQREALLGNAKDAKALGEQIAVLAGKVPQGVEELNQLGRELSKTRLSGKAIVDTMGAVAQATGAVDASAGAKIQELLTRYQNVNRFALGQFELQGTGIDFEDVAKEYAAGTKKSIAAARQELRFGEASIEQGAEAIRKATEKKFGDINLKNAFSLENAPKKFAQQLALLSSGVDLSPITKGLQEAFGQLDENAPLGRAVKTFMTATGEGIVDIAAKSIPILVEGFKWLVTWALVIGREYYEMKKKVKDAFAAENWVGVGGEIVKGLALGILKGNEVLFAGVKNLASMMKKAFTTEMEIHSPSKAFERYGVNIDEGLARGVDRGSSRASRAVSDMVQMPMPQGGGSGGGAPSLEVHIHGAPTNNMQAMQSPAFLAALTQAVRDAVTSRGLPTTMSLAVPVKA